MLKWFATVADYCSMLLVLFNSFIFEGWKERERHYKEINILGYLYYFNELYVKNRRFDVWLF